MMRVTFTVLSLVLAPCVLADYSSHPKAAQLADELAATGEYTRTEVLDVLRKHGVRATFFINSNNLEIDEKKPGQVWPLTQFHSIDVCVKIIDI